MSVSLWVGPSLLSAFFGIMHYGNLKACSEISEALELPALFTGQVSQGISLFLIMAIAWLASSINVVRAQESPNRALLIRGLLLACISGFLIFEWMYLISRFPAISLVSLSLSFRPWTRLLPPSIVGTLVLWPFWFLILHGTKAKALSSAPGPTGP